MQTTKVDHIASAYSKLRISGLTVDPTPEDLELALCRLEDMMSEWAEARNISLGYNFEDDPDPNSVSNAPRWAHDGIGSALALRLIPDFNKEVPPALYAMASASMSAISGRAARDRMRQVQYPSRQPIGSGNRWLPRWHRFYGGDISAPNNQDTTTIYKGDTDDFAESFQSYLDAGESISSFTIAATSGLTIDSSSISGDSIAYTLTASDIGSNEAVTIVMTTDAGRVDTRVVSYIVVAP